MSQQPPLKVPEITHTPSPKPPPSPTSSTYSSTATEDISDSGEELPPTIMEPADFLTHGDLRSPGREFARERSLRKKPTHRYPSSTSVHTAPVQIVQPRYPSDEEDDKRKNMTPEERSLARKKAKKALKAAKRKALKSQEPVKNPRKREDKRQEDKIAAVEASLAALTTSEATEDGHADGAPNSPDRQRRRSSNALQRPNKPRKTASCNQAGGAGGLKSPKLGVDPEDTTSQTNKRNSPHFNARHAAAFAQFNVEEGIHERSNDIDYHIASQAKLEAMGKTSRAGRLAEGLEEIERLKRERKQNEALRGVVDAAQEKYEDEKLAKLYGLK